MPSLVKIFTLIALIALPGVFASPHPGVDVPSTALNCADATGVEMCLRYKTARSLSESPSREPVPSSLTNAERLARHLPLKPPTRRSSARRAMASPVVAPSTNRGYIQVLSADSNGNPTGVLGYVARTTYINTQYLVTPSLDDALLVAPSGDRDLLTLNSDIAAPAFLGLVQGRDDTSSGLATGSSNYLYLASTAQTSPGSTPQNVGNSFTTVYGDENAAESAVWTLDPVNRSLIAQWINSDGSRAPTIGFTQGSAIYFSGDLGAFQQMYPAPVQQVVFVYVPV